MRTGKMLMVDSVEVIIRNRDGKILRRHKLCSGKWHRFLVKLGLAHNCITQTGMAAVARRINGVTETAFTYLAIGIGATNDAATDSTLQDEVKRKASTCTVLQTTVANDTAQWVATFSVADTTPTNNASDAILEIGVLNASSNGILLIHIAGGNYGSADTCNWTNGDTYQLIVKCKVEQGA